MFSVVEIFLYRIRKCLGKKMRIQWDNYLSIEYLEEQGCWATLQQIDSVVSFHKGRFNEIASNCKRNGQSPSHDLTFATSFITTVLFLNVKGSRPMTYQYLTVDMILGINENGIINQTKFKTNEKYGFDSLIFEKETLKLIMDYITYVRPLLCPKTDYLLATRNGTQHRQLSSILARMTYLAIGKYIHPTRYRQIIETESATRLTTQEQLEITADQKHSSQVARVHYRKLKSQDVAVKSKCLLSKLKENVPLSTCSNFKSEKEIYCSRSKNIDKNRNVIDISSDA